MIIRHCAQLSIHIFQLLPSLLLNFELRQAVPQNIYTRAHSLHVDKWGTLSPQSIRTIHGVLQVTQCAPFYLSFVTIVWVASWLKISTTSLVRKNDPITGPVRITCHHSHGMFPQNCFIGHSLQLSYSRQAFRIAASASNSSTVIEICSFLKFSVFIIKYFLTKGK